MRVRSLLQARVGGRAGEASRLIAIGEKRNYHIFRDETRIGNTYFSHGTKEEFPKMSGGRKKRGSCEFLGKRAQSEQKERPKGEWGVEAINQKQLRRAKGP